MILYIVFGECVDNWSRNFEQNVNPQPFLTSAPIKNRSRPHHSNAHIVTFKEKTSEEPTIPKPSP